MKFAASILMLGVMIGFVQAETKAPFPYVHSTAYHVIPETHNEESGYFSLCEGRDGRVYIGTAKYGSNGYLVEFDPVTGQQRVIIDVQELCGLNAAGFAAQAKIHTRNFVGPSGAIYVGSKQGYAKKGDTSKYPGGHMITYDPRTGRAADLGMPFPEQGIADVVADESRNVIYVVTCEDQHWMLYDQEKKSYRELGPMLTPYATTLIDRTGKANVITKDFQLAQYDPETKKITTRPILVGREEFERTNNAAIPTWNLAGDGQTAWLILMNDPHLLSIDLLGKGKKVSARNHGKVIEGDNPDSRCGLTIGRDDKIYTIVSVKNATGFGSGKLHHILRYDPKRKKHEDLGVLKIDNPDFFDFDKGADGKKPPWSHGFHTLPDGTLTPLHHHMALIAGQDNTLYATIIYPFTLLKIDAFRTTPEVSPAGSFMAALQERVNHIEKQIPEITRIAEQCAERHMKGGLIGFPWMGSTLEQELMGRSGGIMHVGFTRPWKDVKERTPSELAMDMVVVSWDDTPKGDTKRIQQYKDKGVFVLGFGPKAHPGLSEHVKLCDAWLDTGNADTDRLIDYSGKRIGKSNHILNAMLGWTFNAEFISALTRKGKMPVCWKSWSYRDGKDWSERYFRKKQFHDDFKVPPIPAGELATIYLDRMRSHLLAFERHQLAATRRVAQTIVKEQQAGKKTVVASSGHMAMNFIGKYDDSIWARNIEVHNNVPSQMKMYREQAPSGGLTLRLGYMGLHGDIQNMFKEKKSRVLLITAEHPYKEFQFKESYPEYIDMEFAFGDACVSINDYPIRLFPASGVMQAIAYECVNVEVLSRL
jgi:hypothetical protein